MKSFYECSFFLEEWKEQQSFVVRQQELRLSRESKVEDNKHKFEILKVEYSCIWEKQPNWNQNKPTIIIPIKDNIKLLKITLNNLISNEIVEYCNVIIVDDRSTENLRDIVINDKASYLRIDNYKGFNFSMLNNIAAKICHSLGCETIIFWNSDLWAPNKEMLKKILYKHELDKNILSGTKLLYPPLEYSINGEEDSENIKTFFPKMTNGRWRNTIQFAGGGFNGLQPYHICRFKDPNDKRVDCDRGVEMITGAFQVWSLKHFISLGGLNPSLSKNYQDNDICLKLLEIGEIPFYYGKSTFLYHDESPSLIIEGTYDLQLNSDDLLFHKFWDNKILTLI
jgi:GT2 family glycosyltransferase